jgi:hypothetical protein
MKVANVVRTMKSAASTQVLPTAALLARLPELMAFRAPYLEEKLVHLGIVDRHDDAARLFQEVKKYLVLAETCADHKLPMFSVRIDEVWHQFVLFTQEYSRFCTRFAGHYLHHAPEEAPRPDLDRDQPRLTFSEFRAAYEQSFGALSPLWLDELCLSPSTRVQCSPLALPLAVYVEDQAAVLRHEGHAPKVICSVNRRGESALRFIATHAMFLLRELPGLSDAERIELCRPLVEFHVLKLAP